MNFEDTFVAYSWTSDRGAQNSWNLKVFKSGTVGLNQVGGTLQDEDFRCDKKDVFVVTSSNLGGEDWEESIGSVKLTLGNCQQVEGTEECDIKVKEDVGLGWNSTFKPEAIFK